MIQRRAFAAALVTMLLSCATAAFAQTTRSHGSIYYSPSGHRIGWAKSQASDNDSDDIANSMCEGGTFDNQDQTAMRNGQAGFTAAGSGPPIEQLLSDCDRVIRFDSESNQGCGGFGLNSDGRVSDGRRGRTRADVESVLSSWSTRFIICNDEPASTGLERFASALGGLARAINGTPSPAPRPAPTIAVAAAAGAPVTIAQAPPQPVFVPPAAQFPPAAPFGSTPFPPSAPQAPAGSNPFATSSGSAFAAGAARPSGVTLSIHLGSATNLYVRCLSEAAWHHFTIPVASMGTYDGATWGVPCQQYAVLGLQTLTGATVPAAALLVSGGPYMITGDEKQQKLSIQPTPSGVIFNDTTQKVTYLWACPQPGGGFGPTSSGVVEGRQKFTFNVGCANASFAFGVGGPTSTFGDGQVGHIVNDPSGNGLRIAIDPPQRGEAPEPNALSIAQLPAQLQSLAAQFPQTAPVQSNPFGQQQQPQQQQNPFGQPQPQPQQNPFGQPQPPNPFGQPQQPAFNPQPANDLAPLIARFTRISACPDADTVTDRVNSALAVPNPTSVGWHFDLVNTLVDFGDALSLCAKRVIGNGTMSPAGEQIARQLLLVSFAESLHLIEAYKLTQDQRFLTVFVSSAHAAIVWRRIIANQDRNPDDLRLASLVQDRITDYAFQFTRTRLAEIGLP